MHVYYKNITRDSDSFDSFNRFMKTILLAATSALEVILLYKFMFYLFTY